jgi:hypothetical protein
VEKDLLPAADKENYFQSMNKETKETWGFYSGNLYIFFI